VSSLYFFFFSSRRRHTRFSRDWSSDVCSSDLRLLAGSGSKIVPGTNFPEKRAWHEFSGLERGALRLFDRRLAALLRQQLRADLRLDIGGHLRVLDQELARVLLALADPVAVVAVPGARFLDDVLAHAEIDDLALARNAVAIQDLELARAERRRDLVLHDLHAGLVAEHLVALLDRADAANVEPHGRIELQRVAARRRLRAAEHHADLHADLVDEDHEAVRALDVRRELAQRLRHQPRVQADVRIAHLAFDLGLRRQRRDRVDDDHVDRARAHEHVRDLERLLTGIGLRDQEVIYVHADLLRINRVERVLGVDERRGAALLLDLRNDLQRQRGLARRFRTVDLDDTPARQPADAE